MINKILARRLIVISLSSQKANYVSAQADRGDGAAGRARTTDEASQINSSRTNKFPYYAGKQGFNAR